MACESGQASLYDTRLKPGLSHELTLLACSCCHTVDSIHIKTCERVFEEDGVGTRATGTRAVHALPWVCDARPGLLSPLDVALSRMLKR